MSEEEPQIICHNYCMQDLETGYCLTCGRPPIPVTGTELNPKTLAGISLKGMTIKPIPGKTSGEPS